MKDYLVVGRIVKPQGIKGELKIFAITDYVKRFDELDYIYVEKDGIYSKMQIKSKRYSGKYVFLMLDGINDRNAAENMRNIYLFIDRSQLRQLPKDTYYMEDLIGMKVFNNYQELLGELVDIIETGSNDVYVVRNNNKELLVPALKRVVTIVDTEIRKMIIDTEAMEGLF